MRNAVAIVVAGIACLGAAFLVTADLTMHGHYHCDTHGVATGQQCNPQGSYWIADRAAWQIPVAIVIAVTGLAAAAFVARREKPDRS